jgi:hypothetical protein
MSAPILTDVDECSRLLTVPGAGVVRQARSRRRPEQPPRKADKSQGRQPEKPRKAKVRAREKPTKAKPAIGQKPRKAKESQ